MGRSLGVINWLSPVRSRGYLGGALRRVFGILWDYPIVRAFMALFWRGPMHGMVVGVGGSSDVVMILSMVGHVRFPTVAGDGAWSPRFDGSAMF
ncbi:hypothetical protein L484_005430 [Morus notabilis]|uniref:Uncharacterized protein n=1 Tax=Morus notabilis TaxID=981085 RepID=W9R140_9ROSA|nr:hypothetical protein L484_005430 [Morus notabilis]